MPQLTAISRLCLCSSLSVLMPIIRTRSTTPALHVACEFGHESLCLLLLAHDASPHLVNCHGQRCYEMGAWERKDKVRTENLVKRIWQDLRRQAEAELEAKITDSSGDSGSAQADGSGQRGSRLRPATPPFFHSSYYRGKERSWYASGRAEAALRRVRADAAPLLKRGLGWDEACKERERAEERVRREDKRRKDRERESLLLQMEERIEVDRQRTIYTRQRRHSARRGGEEGQRAREEIEKEKELQAEHERVQRDRRREASELQEERRQRLQRAEESSRLYEIRAVMTECEQRKELSGKSVRLLRQMRRSTRWMIAQQQLQREKELLQAEELRRRRRSAGQGKDTAAFVFLTELEGQEADPLPQPQQQQEQTQRKLQVAVDDAEDGGPEEEKEDLVNFPPVPVKANTRLYLSRILSEKMAVIPSPPHLLPIELAAPPLSAAPIPRSTARSRMQSAEKEEKTAVSSRSSAGVLWRDVGWNPSLDAAEQRRLRKTGRWLLKVREERVSDVKQERDRRRQEAEEERKDAVILSSLLMDEMRSVMQQQPPADSQRRLQQERQQEMEERKRLIADTFPAFSPHSALYHSLLHAAPLPAASVHSAETEREPALE